GLALVCRTHDFYAGSAFAARAAPGAACRAAPRATAPGAARPGAAEDSVRGVPGLPRPTAAAVAAAARRIALNRVTRDGVGSVGTPAGRSQAERQENAHHSTFAHRY